MAQGKRKWWQKKTNWAIIFGVAAKVIPTLGIAVLLPYAAPLLVVAGALGAYGIADRAGKPNEDVE